MRSLLRFPLPEIFFRWYREKNNNIFRTVLADLGLKGDEEKIENLVRILTMAAEIQLETRLNAFDTKQYYEHFTKRYNSYFQNTPDSKKPSIYAFDDYLSSWALKIWSRALDIIKATSKIS